MNPYTLHQSQVIAEIYHDLGRGDEAQERIDAWHELRDSSGAPGDPPEQGSGS